MNDQSSIPDPLNRRDARRQRREERLADPSRPGGWVAGLVLIVLGAMFLLRNMGSFDFPLQNWWALFILIPAVGAFDSAFRMYRAANNQLTAPARGSLLVGMVLTIVAFMFLFDISWTFFGPVLIILVGIGIIVNAMFR
jgi:peptidoglycan/LPS O-acetylase OafA/YrhL